MGTGDAETSRRQKKTAGETDRTKLVSPADRHIRERATIKP